MEIKVGDKVRIASDLPWFWIDEAVQFLGTEQIVTMAQDNVFGFNFKGQFVVGHVSAVEEVV